MRLFFASGLGIRMNQGVMHNDVTWKCVVSVRTTFHIKCLIPTKRPGLSINGDQIGTLTLSVLNHEATGQVYL